MSKENPVRSTRQRSLRVDAGACIYDGAKYQTGPYAITAARDYKRALRKTGRAVIVCAKGRGVKKPEVTLVDYVEDAAPADYDEYARNLRGRAGDEISYRALYVYGPEEVVLPLIRNLSRLS